MLTALRQQVQQVLYAVPARRKPALRRSDREDFLFATDLPCAAEAAEAEAFLSRMTVLGWRWELHDGWISLDAPVPVPEYEIPQALTGECGCCIAILLRHRGEDGAGGNYIRAITKAAEAGRIPFERVCAQLHGELAVRLRQRRALPGALLPYLCRAYQTFYQ